MLLECYLYANGKHWEKRAGVGRAKNAPTRDVFRAIARSWEHPLGKAPSRPFDPHVASRDAILSTIGVESSYSILYLVGPCLHYLRVTKLIVG